MLFRKAVQADIDAITALYDAIHTEEEAGRGTTCWRRDTYPTRKTAENAVFEGEMFVLEQEGVVVAAGRINQMQDPAYEKATWSVCAPAEQVMVLHTLVVSPSRQGQGLGSAFFRFYEEYALANGCPYLRIDTTDCNRLARRLYRQLGYTEVSIVSSEFAGLPNIRLVCLEKIL